MSPAGIAPASFAVEFRLDGRDSDMTDIATGQAPAKRVVFRHTVIVRITHWINAVCVLFLLMSGLQIFNAHPHLYWGEVSTFDVQNRPVDTFLSIGTFNNGTEGFVQIMGGTPFNTTGFLGLSRYQGELEARAFPAWMTLPSARDLATGRLWHFFFAWIFVINLLVYVVYGLAGRHFWRDLLPSRDQWRQFGRTVWDHMRLRFHHGDARYNILQKLTYIVAILALIVMIVSGLAMSPGMDAKFHWLPDLFGGRQSARTFHFLSATIVVLFAVVHIILVLISGVFNNLRSMITGRYVVKGEKRE
jgi:thiosulfate reductase cytochrome b subunit